LAAGSVKLNFDFADSKKLKEGQAAAMAFIKAEDLQLLEFSSGKLPAGEIFRRLTQGRGAGS